MKEKERERGGLLVWMVLAKKQAGRGSLSYDTIFQN